MQKVLISIPEVLGSRVKDAVDFGGYASKSELFRHAVTLLLDEREKAWAAQRARRDATHIQRHSLHGSMA